MNKVFSVVIIVLFILTSFIPISFGYSINNLSSTESLIINRSTTLYVGGSGPNNYTKIQDAINDSVDGDTVFVYDDSSPYYEEIRIEKSIMLIGENHNTVIDGMNNMHTSITILANYVSITCFSIINNNRGMYVYGDSAIISDVHLMNIMCGISLIFTKNSHISNNIIKNCRIGLEEYHNHNLLSTGSILIPSI